MKEVIRPLKAHLKSISALSEQTGLKLYEHLKHVEPSKALQIAKAIEEEKAKHKVEIERTIRQRFNLPDSHELDVYDTCDED